MPRRLEGSNPSEGTPWSPKDTLIKVSDNSSKVYIQEWLERSPDHWKHIVGRNSAKIGIETMWNPLDRRRPGLKRERDYNAMPTSQLDRVSGEPLTTNFFLQKA